MTRLWAACVALLLAGCTAPVEPRPDIFLISLDTVRGDTARSEMPELARFAQGGLWIDEAYSPIGFTLPAHASLLFGVGIESHRVLSEADRIADAYTSLAEVLALEGYRTVAVVTNEWVKAEFGFDQGFEEYHLLPHAATYADRVVHEVLAAASPRERDGRPLFVFAHFMDAHSDFAGQGTGVLPYWAPPDLTADLDLSRADELFCLDSDRDRCATLWLMEFQAGLAPRPGAMELARALYERGVRGLDRDLRSLWETIERNPRGAIVVVTSDHGEEFLEHGRTIHSQPYEETLNVPLVIRADGRLPATLSAPLPVDLVDLAPTIAALAGVSSPSDWEGRDLTRSTAPRALISRDKLYERWALRTAEWTVVQPLAALRLAAELYDRRLDRREQDNRAPRDGVVSVRLLGALDRAIAIGEQQAASARAAGERSSPPALDSEERKRLESLGYAR